MSNFGPCTIMPEFGQRQLYQTCNEFQELNLKVLLFYEKVEQDKLFSLVGRKASFHMSNSIKKANLRAKKGHTNCEYVT